MGKRIDGPSIRRDMDEVAAILRGDLAKDSKQRTENIDNISQEQAQEEGEEFLRIIGLREASFGSHDGGNEYDDTRVEEAHKAAEKLAQSALGRLQKGLKYGLDMASSSVVCYEDAISLLQKALDGYKKAGVRP